VVQFFGTRIIGAVPAISEPRGINMVEIFKNTRYDFLGKKRYFIGLSLLFILVGAISVCWRAFDRNPQTRAFNLGVDFAGGTLINAKFQQAPEIDKLRAAIERQGIESSKITIQPVGDQLGQAPKHEVFIRLPNLLTVERQAGQSVTAARATDDADNGKQKVLAALAELNDPATRGKTDLNLVGRDILKEQFSKLDPLKLNEVDPRAAALRYGELSGRIVDYRERERGGIINSLSEIKNLSGIEPQLGAALEQHFFTGAAALRSAEAVSPQIGADLRNRAVYVTLAACVGMLIYVALRFKSWGYGLGAVVAVFHDVLVTLGIFSIMQWEVDLNLVGSLLSLIGFSMNDTIVIFDRVRDERLRKRREGLVPLTNRAINETLSRTVLTNGTAFLAALSLVLFGGDVLKSFSWALLIGILVGTYSTLYIASPFMLWWEKRRGRDQQLLTEGSADIPAVVPGAVPNTTVSAKPSRPRPLAHKASGAGRAK
jgi:preprotein translocase subunit SecF